MKGYKAVNADGTAKHGDVVYEVGGTYTVEGGLKPCENGIHFCERCADVFRYYPFGSRVFEVEAVGEVVTEGDKSCTDWLRVVRELTAGEVSELCNSGHRNSGNCNSGNCNSGHRNSGHRNSGDWNSGHRNSGHRNSGHRNSGHRNSGHRNSGHRNSGHRNSGDWNSGDWNSGDWNSGNCNSGNCNSGNCNSGDWNSGDWNSGDWNATDFSSGVLCTEVPECLIFDEPSGMTLGEWRATEAARLMSRIEVPAPSWREWGDLTDAEREAHARCECQGGVLVEPEDAGMPRFAEWWDGLTERERGVIMAIPNFDAAKWKKITGIEVD